MGDALGREASQDRRLLDAGSLDAKGKTVTITDHVSKVFPIRNLIASIARRDPHGRGY